MNFKINTGSSSWVCNIVNCESFVIFHSKILKINYWIKKNEVVDLIGLGRVSN